MDKVCAVVVTYNRKELLIKCLEALRKQTRPLQGICIVDNASTDKTPELLLEKGYIKQLPPENLKKPWEKEFEIENLKDGKPIKIHYIRMHENTGGAGGFHEGMKRAYEKGYDWLWLMDDDVEPYENALEELFKYSHLSEAFQSHRIYKNGKDVLWYGYLDIFTGNMVHLDMKRFKKHLLYTNVATFEGLLIKKTVISRIGLPCKDMFIVGDDTIWGLKINLYTNLFLVKRSVFIRKTFRKKPLTPRFLYFYVRNRIVILKEIEKLYGKRYSFIRKIFDALDIIRYYLYTIRDTKNIIDSTKAVLRGLKDRKSILKKCLNY